MMRYYDLDIGTVRGSYALPQPGMELVLLEEAPDDESMWDGTVWVPDQEKIDARLAEEAADQVSAAAKTAIASMPGWASWSAAEATAYIDKNVTTLATAKTVMKAMAQAIIYLRDHSRIVR